MGTGRCSRRAHRSIDGDATAGREAGRAPVSAALQWPHGARWAAGRPGPRRLGQRGRARKTERAQSGRRLPFTKKGTTALLGWRIHSIQSLWASLRTALPSGRCALAPSHCLCAHLARPAEHSAGRGSPASLLDGSLCFSSTSENYHYFIVGDAIREKLLLLFIFPSVAFEAHSRVSVRSVLTEATPTQKPPPALLPARLRCGRRAGRGSRRGRPAVQGEGGHARAESHALLFLPPFLWCGMPPSALTPRRSGAPASRGHHTASLSVSLAPSEPQPGVSLEQTTQALWGLRRDCPQVPPRGMTGFSSREE